MFFRLINSKAGRLLRVAAGGAMVIDAITRNFAVAVPMVLFGSIVAVSGVAGVCIVEELYIAGLRHGYVAPPKRRHRHA